MQKIIITADIHSNLEAFQKLPPGKTISAGDLIGYGANPNEVIEAITGADWTCTLGNHDWAGLTKETGTMNTFATEAALWTFDQLTPASRKYLTSLPKTLALEIEGKKLLIAHGSPRDPLNEYLYTEDKIKTLLKNSAYDILITGHTHLPLIVEHKGKLAINPGSVGQPRDNNPALSYAELTLPDMTVKIVRKPYDLEKAAEKILNAGLPPVLAQRLKEGW